MKAMLGSSLQGGADTSMGTNGTKGAKSLWVSALSLCLLQVSCTSVSSRSQRLWILSPGLGFFFSRGLANTC